MGVKNKKEPWEHLWMIGVSFRNPLEALMGKDTSACEVLRLIIGRQKY